MSVDFVSPVSETRSLTDRVARIIRNKSNNAPRSLQIHLGPSELGTECVRRLSYRLLDWDRTNTTSDPWPSVSGTAIHTWLAEAFEADDHEWLVEEPVFIDGQRAGTVDLFDPSSGMVIDHKCVGAASMKKAKLNGASHQQLVQLNLYAYGLEQAGHKINRIALVFYPLGGMLDGLHVWTGEYNRQMAIDALSRIENIKNLIVLLDPEATPKNWEQFPATTSRLCTWCPWYKPKSEDLSQGCPGDSL